ncbi:MAG: hypothetical protein WC149_06625 [Arcobacteraceae bacterium]
MKLLLICKTPIIVKIFTLVSKKLNILLTVQGDNHVDEKFDIIVLDSDFVDDRFNSTKQFCSKIGAISSQDLPFDKSRDFIIPRPFLPAQLQEILEEVIASINHDLNQRIIEQNKYNARASSTTDEVVNYVNSLADDIANDIENENDESIVSFASMKKGGVLDSKELGKIQSLLNIEPILNEVDMNEDDWLDLSEIIDKALEEVKDYEFDLTDSGAITLVLSRFTMEELKPLLLKLNQNSIDKLTTGGSIHLELKLKDES